MTDDVTSHADILTDNMDTGVGSVYEGKLRDTHWKDSQTSAKSPKEERKWLHGQYLATAGWDSFWTNDKYEQRNTFASSIFFVKLEILESF